MKKKQLFKSSILLRDDPKNIKPADRLLFKHEKNIELPDVFLIKENDVLIYDGCLVIDSNKTPLNEFSNIYSYPQTKIDKLKHHFKKSLSRTVYLKGDYVWATDSWSNGYFHWMMDTLPRLYCISQNSNCEEVLLPNTYKDKAFIIESLGMFGFKPIYFDPAHNVKVEGLTTCSYLANTGNYNPEVTKELREKILSEIQQSFQPWAKNIYISRNKANRRKVINEDEVINLLKSFDFSFYNMEDLSWEQQVSLLHKADNVVSIHGAALTNCMFMLPGRNVLELRKLGDRISNCYYSLCDALGLTYYYLQCEGDNENNTIANLHVNITQLEGVVQTMISKRSRTILS